MRLYIVLHSCRAAGGLYVGINFIKALVSVAPNNLVLGLCLPDKVGYEEVVRNIGTQIFWFKSSSNVISRLWFDRIILPSAIKSFRPDSELIFGNIGLPFSSNAIRVHFLDDAHYVYSKKHYGRMAIKETLRYKFQKLLLRKSFSRSKIVFTQTKTMEKRLRVQLGYRGLCGRMPNSLSMKIISEPLNGVAESIESGKVLKCVYLTRYYGHKNIELIVETFRNYKERLKNISVCLTISAEQDPNARKLIKQIRKFRLEDMIKCVGPVFQGDIGKLFAKHNCLLFPTLMESFGATYLEAMHFGLPIITSDLDFAHEMCGRAALYINPWSPDALAEALIYLRDNPQERIRLVKLGKNQLKNRHSVTWQQIVEDCIEVIRTAVDQRRNYSNV